MIFQRGNPMDYDQWATESTGMERLGLRPLSALLQADGEPPDRRRRLPGRRRSAATRDRTGRQPSVRAWLDAGEQAGFDRHRRRQRLPTGGVRSLRQERRAGPPPERRPGLPAPGARPSQPHVGHARSGEPDPLRRHPGDRSRVPASRASPTRRAAAEIISCGGAFNSPQLLQLSGIGDPDHLRGSGSTSSPPCPAWARTSRITSRSTSSTTAPSRCRCSRNWRSGGCRSSGCNGWLRRGPAATNHFEAGAFVRSNDRVDYPNLMFHFLPLAIRYDGSSPTAGSRLSGARGPDVLRRARHGEDHLDRPTITPGGPVQLPVDRERPPRMGRDGPHHPAHHEPTGLRRVQRRRDLAGPVGRDRRGDPRVGRPRSRDRPPPIVHRCDGDR